MCNLGDIDKCSQESILTFLWEHMQNVGWETFWGSLVDSLEKILSVSIE